MASCPLLFPLYTSLGARIRLNLTFCVYCVRVVASLRSFHSLMYLSSRSYQAMIRSIIQVNGGVTSRFGFDNRSKMIRDEVSCLVSFQSCIVLERGNSSYETASQDGIIDPFPSLKDYRYLTRLLFYVFRSRLIPILASYLYERSNRLRGMSPQAIISLVEWAVVARAQLRLDSTLFCYMSTQFDAAVWKLIIEPRVSFPIIR